MTYAITSNHGVFIGEAMGLAFFAGQETAGQTHAVTFERPEDAQTMLTILDEHGCEGLALVAVVSGHWKDLQAAGLAIGDMEANELANRIAAD
jgi:hypothetical protein